MMVSRRFFLAGSVALLAAPAIVRASSLMQIKPVRWLPADEAAARILAQMDAWDSSPEGKAQMLWDANPGLLYTRLEGQKLLRPEMPKEFIQIVQERMANA